ncbi:hypothetical protein [Paraburkholderia kirstenboschensis]|uniref:hypothetical protein n=1 Tax=Paraburkholderia kirstenboschensis TaxID=1245436 RepID=UPI00191B5E35|nr:hypothetical protein [Paraburkholderia kirstenboschensis]
MANFDERGDHPLTASASLKVMPFSNRLIFWAIDPASGVPLLVATELDATRDPRGVLM